MGHYARGDSRKMICSSDEEEGYSATSQHASRTDSTMSQMNLRDKRNLILGTFGEAPPLPLPPVSDETDRQFWAEDELSSCDSRHHLMIAKRKRRHSVAYRNRAAVHTSHSGFVQSTSSSTETARFNVPPAVKRRRRKHRNYAGTSRFQRTKVASSGVQTKFHAKTVSRVVAVGNNFVSDRTVVQPTVHDEEFNLSLLSSRKNDEASGTTRTNDNITPLQIPSKSDVINVRKNRMAKMKSSTKSRRN